MNIPTNYFQKNKYYKSYSDYRKSKNNNYGSYPPQRHRSILPPNFEVKKLGSDNNKEEKKVQEEENLSDMIYIEYDGSNIHNLEELIEFLYNYSQMDSKETYKGIHISKQQAMDLQHYLKKLHNLIGLDDIKDMIFHVILHYIQESTKKRVNMLHTVIQGPPGCGKTELGRILGECYACIGIIDTPKMVVAKRHDLVAHYLGQTASKTQEVIDSAKGGVLFIDEAYSLGNDEGKDIFAKECINTLNQSLTEDKCDFICIIAGYKDKLQSCFFSFNAGLERRFPFKLTIPEYDHTHLSKIFIKLIRDMNLSWNVDEDILLDFFKVNRKKFVFNGGDIENYIHFMKLIWSKNHFCRTNSDNTITRKDLDDSLELMYKNRGEKELEFEDNYYKNMYL